MACANLELGYGYCLSAIGEIEKAKEKFEHSASIFRTTNMASSQAQALNGLGNVEEALGEHTKAVQEFSQALELEAIIHPAKPQFQAVTLQNLAIAESRASMNRDARGHLEAALNVLKKHKNPVLEARIYCGLGEIYFKLADVAQAESAIRQGIELATKINDDASLWRDYTIQAKLEFTQGQEGTAKESLVSALSYLRSPESGLFPTPERLWFPDYKRRLS